MSSRTKRPIRIISLGVAAVAAAVLGVALIPGGEQRNDLISLESASAAKVLDRSATGAMDTGSLVPGPGEVLYFRSVQYSEPDAEPQVWRTEEWIDADGSGLRREQVATPARKPIGEPITVRFSDNPATGTRAGTQGVTIGVTLDLLPKRAAEPSYSAGLWTLEIVLDPVAGRMLETREHEPESAGPTVTSYESLKLTAKAKSPL